MKLLLDTHTLLWATSDEKKLSTEIRDQIANPGNIVFVSLVSLWELRIKESIKKINLPRHFYQSLIPAGYEILSLTLAHLEAYAHLPLYHRDPFDRMLVAQAKLEQLVLLTRDPELEKYDVHLLKA
ncbi:MAG: type II toxin-antitoxin system VapC family toxin [Deltaproteobacteria bacterium]|nr:type II toxin-antitoxin system VapC family toxin [Deltaproteobacteria bacterium]